MSGGRLRITKQAVDALRPGETIWDGETRGFGVRRQRKARTYVLKFRTGGRQRFVTIGHHGAPWTPEMARREARRLLGELAGGLDPAAAREAEKVAPTVRELGNQFLAEHTNKLKPKTLADYRALLDKRVTPALGDRQVRSVTRTEIARLHHGMAKTPYLANYVVRFLSSLFTWAERHGHRPDGSNPCRHVKPFRVQRRERFLSEVELARLGEVLTEAERTGESPFVVAAIRLLVFTGARRDEIRLLRWSEVDLEHACLRLRDSKTGQKIIYLSAPALEVLAGLPRLASNPHVICGRKPGAALVNLEKPWQRIRAEAGLEGVRLHDLRHSFASSAAAGGVGLLVIGKLLGHQQSAVTERYAHLAADPLRAANEAVGRRIAAALTRGSSGKSQEELPSLHDGTIDLLRRS